MSESTGVEFQSIGVCVKSLDGTVQTQNRKCVEICGDQLGKRCTFGCGLVIANNGASRSMDFGFSTFRCVMEAGGRINVALINDGLHLTSLLCEVTDSVRQHLDEARRFSLSKSEITVLELYLQGYSNAEAAARLFISRTTLRTHLNNIYKKIPSELKNKIVSSHLGLLPGESLSAKTK